MLKSNIFLLFFVFCLSFTSLAQKTSDITGKVTNTDNEPLVAATAILYFEKDSVITAYGITDEQGFFEIKNIAASDYYLQFSFLGYNGKNLSIEKSDFDGGVDMGTIQLTENTELETITITNAPLEVRKDTIIYDASAFSTKQNATVEDLLKELPGIEVEDDGNITAQGETVEKVLVDGKKFFGDDPKIATQNLPADAVDKIEVYDKQSEKAEFTGIKDGEEQKTIDIKLKEDHKSGYFGNVEAGGGTEETYNAKAMISRFSPTIQLSTIASRNNINELSFSPRDYFSMNSSRFSSSGGVMRMDGNMPRWNQDSGINTATTGGVNLNTALSDEVDIYTTYFFNQTKTRYDLLTNREYFDNQGGLFYTENNAGDNLINNHRAAIDLTYRPSKNDELKLETAFNFANGDRSQLLESNTLESNNEMVNDNITNQTANNNSTSIETTLFYKHRFAKKGRSLFTEFSLNNTSIENNTETNSLSNFYSQNTTDSYFQLLQAVQDEINYSGEISYSEPLGNEQYLELNYQIEKGEDENDQDFYDLENDLYMEDLSNVFNRDLLTQNAGINYKLIKGKHNVDIGAEYEKSDLTGITSLSSAPIEKNFSQILPSFHWSINLKEGSNLNFRGGSNMRVPSVRQLQPAIDNTNPLHIYKGNENLIASTDYNLGGSYHMFNRFSFTNIYAYADVTYTNNPITNSQSIDVNGVQTSQPINTDNSIQTRARVSFSKSLRAIRSRLRISPRFTSESGQIYINGNQNDYQRYTHGYIIRIDNTNNDVFDIGLNSSLTFNNTSYSEDSDRDQNYNNHNYGIDVNYKGLENWEFYSDLDYRTFSQEQFADDNAFTDLTAGVSRSFAKNLGEIRLEFRDLLNQNSGINRSQNFNYSQEEISNVLGRYGILSLRWQIKSGGTSGSKSNGPPPPPPR